MLMEHNIEAYRQFKSMLRKYHECCLVATTGIGKSNMAIEFINSLKNPKILVICPKISICKNWEKYAKKYGIDNLETVTYHTFSKSYNEFYRFSIYILDEVHHAGSEVWGAAILNFKKKLNKRQYFIGLTADPIRYCDNCQDVSNTVFNSHVVYGLDQITAINAGLLPKASYIYALFDSEGLYKYYSKKQMTDSLRGKLQYSFKNTLAIKDILIKHTPRNKVKGILFVDRISSINAAKKLLQNVFPDLPVQYIHSSLSDKEVDESIRAFEDSDSGFIITINMLNEGLHIEGINTIIMLRKTFSPSIYMQQIGRGMSIDNKDLTIFDLVGNSTSIRTSLKRVKFEVSDAIAKLSKLDNFSMQSIVFDYASDLLSVLEEIDTRRWMPWLESEDKILIDNYKSMGPKKVSKLLPGRSSESCFKRAQLLGINTVNMWTDDEIKILKEYYPLIGIEVYKMLPGRTKRQCYEKAYGGLGLINNNIWTPEEIKILIDNYPSIGGKVVELLPKRSKSSCSKMARKLNIKSNKTVWTSEEEKIIIEHDKDLDKLVELLPDKSRDQIYFKCRQLKDRGEIQFECKKNRQWTEDDDRIIIENYPKMGTKVISLLDGNVTKNQVRNRARVLNVKYDR